MPHKCYEAHSSVTAQCTG